VLHTTNGYKHRKRIFNCHVTATVNSLQARTMRVKAKHVFHGACIDTGAQRTVIGLPQARAYPRLVGRVFSTRPSASSFRFGDGPQLSLGMFSIRFPLPGNRFIYRDVDVVPVDIPLLLGLDLMDELSVLFDNTTNILTITFTLGKHNMKILQ
jgi:hypothetical protein